MWLKWHEFLLNSGWQKPQGGTKWHQPSSRRGLCLTGVYRPDRRFDESSDFLSPLPILLAPVMQSASK